LTPGAFGFDAPDAPTRSRRMRWPASKRLPIGQNSTWYRRAAAGVAGLVFEYTP